MRFGDTDGGPVEDPESGRPIDLAALRADDELIDAIAAGRTAPAERTEAGPDDELIALLAAWVADVRPEDEPSVAPVAVSAPVARTPLALALAGPVPVGPELPRPAAVAPADARPGPATPTRPARPIDRRRSVLEPFARRLVAAATLAVLASSGLAVGAAGSTPGEVLWPVSEVVYADRATSVVAATEVTDQLSTARTALREGRRGDAARVIATVGARLGDVGPAERRGELTREHELLRQVLAASGGPPAASDLLRSSAPRDIEPSTFLLALPDADDLLADPPPVGDGPAPAPPAVDRAPSDTSTLAGSAGSAGTAPDGSGSGAGPADGSGPAGTTAPSGDGRSGSSSSTATTTTRATAATGSRPTTTTGRPATPTTAPATPTPTTEPSGPSSSSTPITSTPTTSSPTTSTPPTSTPTTSSPTPSTPTSSSPTTTSPTTTSPTTTSPTTTSRTTTTRTSTQTTSSSPTSSAPPTTSVPAGGAADAAAGGSGTAPAGANDFIGPVVRPDPPDTAGDAPGR